MLRKNWMYLCTIPMFNIAIRYVQSIRYGLILVKAMHFEKFCTSLTKTLSYRYLTLIYKFTWSSVELFVGVFGGLDLHGKNHTVTWTTLSQTADSGANQITLTDAVDWAVNDEIVITATSYKAWEVEIRKISAVSADKKTLTLNATLANKHICK